MALSMLSMAVMSVADAFVCGRYLGQEALAGVALGNTAVWTCYLFGTGFLRSIKICGSQAHGAGKDPFVFLSAGLVAALGLGAIFSFLGFFCAPLLRYLASSDLSRDAAIGYAQTRLMGAVIFMLFVAMRESRYAVSDSTSPLVAIVVGNIANVSLNFLFVLGFGLGVRAVAAATICSVVLQLLIVSGLNLDMLRALPRFKAKNLRSLIKIGLPMAIEYDAEMFAYALSVGLVARMGDEELAGHNIAVQVVHFSFLPAIAISDGVAVLVGQAKGALRYRMPQRVVRIALVFGILYAGLFALIYFLGGHAIAQLFEKPGSDSAMVDIAGGLLTIAAFFQFSDVFVNVLKGGLSGLGDVRIPAMITIAATWLLLPPLTWYLGMHLGWGAAGAWIGIVAETIVVAFAYGMRFKNQTRLLSS